MAKLEKSTIYRAGLTARSYDMETRAISLTTSTDYIGIKFDMASAGGGTTQVWVRLDSDDYKAITDAIGESHAAKVEALKAAIAVYKEGAK